MRIFLDGLRKTEKLYEEIGEDGKQEIADELLLSIDGARREKWTDIPENQKASIQVWYWLRTLRGSKPLDQPRNPKPNGVPHSV